MKTKKVTLFELTTVTTIEVNQSARQYTLKGGPTGERIFYPFVFRLFNNQQYEIWAQAEPTAQVVIGMVNALLGFFAQNIIDGLSTKLVSLDRQEISALVQKAIEGD